ncbi:helix-turn-helix transcriptional regulator [Saccharomonospora piscinae]|uniref:Helix-turn-helix transcriptional regulator n=1 Tax=Saccharomonospora piscinae TaxID=687388 RepID=A0A1V9A9V9_SACPI|nr:LuxR family transcriptional regulator [Saccharomonospora piscinae]OQO93917.1 helix-turn-helix transcriptional regulator [Saccharomonospora piscinae]TLW95088.1 response regulator transcription factor [Saccharomonospora piscinae]
MYLPLETVRQVVSAVDAVAEIADPESFPGACLPSLCALVAGDAVVYHDVDLHTGKNHHVEFRTVRPPPVNGFAHHVTVTVLPFAGFRATIEFLRQQRPFTDVERGLCELLGEPIATTLRRLHDGHPPVPGDTGLTLREREIVRLVALGRTNAAIAHELALSPRTVAKHLEHVYRKLRVDGRAAAVARVLG